MSQVSASQAAQQDKLCTAQVQVSNKSQSMHCVLSYDVFCFRRIRLQQQCALPG